MSRAIVSFAVIALAAAACGDSGSTEPTSNPASTKPSSPLPPPVPTPPAPTPRPATTEYIYLAATDGSGATQLTMGAWASWSPDGRRLAFHRATSLVPASIYVIDADGTHETRLLAGTSASWSPDGKQIAFVDAEGIEVMDADGSNKKLLLRHLFRDDTYRPSDMGIGEPAWSPDGKRIAFMHLGDGDTQPAQVFVMNADGSNPRRVSVGPTFYAESDPAWSPDGSQLAYWSFGYGLEIIDVESGTPRSVYTDFPAVSYGARPAWSRDGRTLAFNRWQSGVGSTRSILVLGLVAHGVQVLVPDGHDLAYSPDQKRIAYSIARNDST